MMMIVLRLLSLPGLNRGVFPGNEDRWIRGLLAKNPCAIGIQPVHTRVDSCGLPTRAPAVLLLAAPMPDLLATSFLTAAAVAVIAGMVRGFAGFGAAMMMTPVF